MSEAYEDEFKRLLFTLPDLVNCTLCGDFTCVRTEPLNTMHAYVCYRCKKQMKTYLVAKAYGMGEHRVNRLLAGEFND